MATHNPPYDGVHGIFRSFFYSLVKAIEPVYLEVSNKLYTDGWISPHDHPAGEPPEVSATRIVKEVETQLK